MSENGIRVGEIFGVIAFTGLLAACAVVIGYLAFRRQHFVIDLFEQLARRMDPLARNEGRYESVARMNIIVVAIFLLWVSFLVCLGGIRFAIT